MATRLNWTRAYEDKKMRVQGVEATDDLLPRAPARGKTTTTGNSLAKSKSTTGGDTPKTSAKHARKSGTGGNRSSLDLMHFVADSIVREQWVSDKAPKSITRELSAQVSKAGGLLAWANSQPQFQDLLQRKKRKKLKREVKNTGKAALSKSVKGATKASDAIRRKERIKHLRLEIAQAEESIRFAQEEISRLQ